jgi:hypothetical protein
MNAIVSSSQSNIANTPPILSFSCRNSRITNRGVDDTCMIRRLERAEEENDEDVTEEYDDDETISADTPTAAPSRSCKSLSPLCDSAQYKNIIRLVDTEKHSIKNNKNNGGRWQEAEDYSARQAAVKRQQQDKEEDVDSEDNGDDDDEGSYVEPLPPRRRPPTRRSDISMQDLYDSHRMMSMSMMWHDSSLTNDTSCTSLDLNNNDASSSSIQILDSPVRCPPSTRKCINSSSSSNKKKMNASDANISDLIKNLKLVHKEVEEYNPSDCTRKERSFPSLQRRQGIRKPSFSQRE